jgi:hypothetical protein
MCHRLTVPDSDWQLNLRQLVTGRMMMISRHDDHRIQARGGPSPPGRRPGRPGARLRGPAPAASGAPAAQSPAGRGGRAPARRTAGAPAPSRAERWAGPGLAPGAEPPRRAAGVHRGSESPAARV